MTISGVADSELQRQLCGDFDGTEYADLCADRRQQHEHGRNCGEADGRICAVSDGGGAGCLQCGDEECGWAADAGAEHGSVGGERCGGGAALLPGGVLRPIRRSLGRRRRGRRLSQTAGVAVRGERWTGAERMDGDECGAGVELFRQRRNAFGAGCGLSGDGHLADGRWMCRRENRVCFRCIATRMDAEDGTRATTCLSWIAASSVDTMSYQPQTSTLQMKMRGTAYQFSPQAFTRRDDQCGDGECDDVEWRGECGAAAAVWDLGKRTCAGCGA